MSKAYIIVDMSNDFVADNGSLSAGAAAQKIVPAIISRADAFVKTGEIVVLAMDEHEPDDSHFALWTPHNVIDTWGLEPFGKLKDWFEENKAKTNVFYLPKGEYDAFYETPLNAILKENGVDEVYVSGVCTDICVFNTVYGAYKNGYATFVAKDECATFTGYQELFLSHMNLIYKTTIL